LSVYQLILKLDQKVLW